MLKFFKNIFVHKTADDSAVENNGHAPRIPAATQPRALAPQAPPRPQAYTPVRQHAPSQHAPSQHAPAPVSARPVAPAPSAPPAGATNGSSLQLGLQSILNNLPIELKGRVKQIDVGAAEISIPFETVLSQLSTGSVRITFGQMRRAAPQLFTSQTDLDETPVMLPLGEILAQLNPALLFRRQQQKRIEVPEDVRSPFGDDGAGLVFSVGPNKGAAPAPAPARAAAPVPNPPMYQPRQTLAPASQPVAPEPAPTPISMPSVPFRAPARTPAPPVAPVSPAPARVAAHAPIPAARPTKPAFAPAPTQPSAAARPAVQPTQRPVAPVAGGPTLDVAITGICGAWPESLKLEIVQSDLSEAKVAVPMDVLKNALQHGKVSFPWKVIRSWIIPAVPQSISAHDNTSLEIPLHILAPLFIARERDLAKSRQKVAIDDTIPNLFFGFPQSEPAVPGVPPTPAACSVARPVDTNYYPREEFEAIEGQTPVLQPEPKTGGTEFLARTATPNEIVTRAAALGGVAGAIIALPDGLMVASKLAPDLNGDTIAAFLPQIFGKVSQCTKELRMGDLNNLNFTVGQVPWKIFRVNAIFFAAFGRAGQPLPSLDLATLAAELDRKKQ